MVRPSHKGSRSGLPSAFLIPFGDTALSLWTVSGLNPSLMHQYSLYAVGMANALISTPNDSTASLDRGALTGAELAAIHRAKAHCGDKGI
jgi:hypothetical protein